MRAFWASVAVAVVLAVVAWAILDNLGMSSANVFSTANVRL
jgi:hypothetical protein